MGCSGDKEKLEDQMMLVKLKRMEIQMEKEKELKKLSEIEGKPVKRGINEEKEEKIIGRKRLRNEQNENVEEKEIKVISKKNKNTKKEAKNIKNKNLEENEKDEEEDKKEEKKYDKIINGVYN